MGRFRDAWQALTQKTAPAGGGEIGFLGQTIAGLQAPRKGQKELLDAYRTSPFMRAVTHRIASSVAGTFRPRLYTAPVGDPARKRIVRHPLLDLLRSPTPHMPALMVWKLAQLSLDLVGNGFLVMDRNAYGLPIEFTPAAPHWVIRYPTTPTPYFWLSVYGISRQVNQEDMLWLRDPDPLNPYGRGVGTSEALADEIDTDEAISKRVKGFFYNGALPDFFVGAEGAGEEEAKRIEETLRAKYGGGPGKQHGVFFTTRKWSIDKVDTNFKDMDLVNVRKFERDAMISVYGVPPEIFGVLQNSNRATVDAAYYLYAKSVLVPRHELLCSEIQEKIVPEYIEKMPELGEELYLEVENPVPEDRDFVLRAMATGPSAFTKGELRELAGHLPGPNAEEPLSNGDLKPLGPSTPTQLPPGKGGDPAWTRDVFGRGNGSSGHETPTV